MHSTKPPIAVQQPGVRIALAIKKAIMASVQPTALYHERAQGKESCNCAGTFLVVLVLGPVWLSWDHIQFWWLFEPLGRNEQGYPEYRHREAGIVMVRVPGGTFMMGSKEASSYQMRCVWR